MIHAFQICNGLGCGNIGDEIMARAFWDQLPDNIRLEVPRFPNASLQHDAYPPQHRYIRVDFEGCENDHAAIPGLLVGDTPVADREGLEWPLRFLAPRLLHFHRAGLPVDAIGVGVDLLEDSEAKELFASAYLPIRSWTVRTPACRDALLDLGVSESRIRVGSDLAWLYTTRGELDEWAAALWNGLNVDTERPLLVANLVNMIWRDEESRRHIAAGLDEVARRHGLQIAFFCNESRDGEFFDFAAAKEMAERMKTPAQIVPNEFYSPDEAIAILRHANVTLSQRYHFVVQTIMADSVPVGMLRGQKMRGLASELGFPVAGTIEEVDREKLVDAVAYALENRRQFIDTLAEARRNLTGRARNNLSFLHELQPYCDSFRHEDGS